MTDAATAIGLHPRVAAAAATRSALLSRVFDEAVTGMALLDTAGRFSAVNSAWCRMVGRSEAELLGMRTAEITHPDDRAGSESTIERLAAGLADDDQVRKRYVRPDGSVVTVLRTTTVRRDASGRHTGFLTQIADVSEAVEAQDALRRSDMRFRAMVAHASDLIVLLDRDARIVYASPASSRLLGYDPCDIEGRSVFDVLHPADHGRAHAAFDDRLNRPGGGPGDPAHYRIRHRDGTWHEIEVVTTDLFDDPDVGAAVVNVRDVTAEVRYRDGLAASEERLRALIGSSWDVITLHDADGRYLYCSPAITAQLGYDPDDLVGTDPRDLLHPDDAVNFGHFSDLLDGAETGSARQYRVRDSTGAWRWLESTARNRLDDPAVAGIVVTTRDITARRRRTAQQDALAALSGSAVSGGPLAELFDQALRLVTEALGVGHGAILRLDAGGRLGVVARRGPALVQTAYAPAQAGAAVSFPAVALRDGRSVVWGEATPAGDAELHPLLRDTGLRSGAAAVIGAGAEPYGVLSVRSPDADSFSRDDVSFLEGTANVLAAAIGRRRVEDELRRQALHDGLTGLANRVLLVDRLADAIGRLGRSGRQLALLFIDTDDFKLINDSLGHAAGDRVVATVARRVSGVVRATDTVARFGGDEFVVLCESVDAGTAEDLAGRLRRVLAEPIELDDRQIVVTVSVGIAVTDDPGVTPDDLLSRADTAMYAAKQAGKDRSVVFDVRMRRRVTEQLDASSGLRRALAADELRLHFQPVVRTVTGAVSGAEALLRWQHPAEGLLGPDRFIPYAESSGLIVPIGAWVLRTACRQAAAWSRAGARRSVAVNVSGRQLLDADIVTTVAEALADSGADPHLILLEVTEHAVMSDVQRAARTISELRALGVHVGMDDFGTGHSSLSHLANLPFDFVKIDRSFIARFDQDRRTAGLLETIATLCRTLDLAAVAEGVETIHQRQRVVELGIPYIQGFLFGRPRPVDDFPGSDFLRPVEDAGS